MDHRGGEPGLRIVAGPRASPTNDAVGPQQQRAYGVDAYGPFETPVGVFEIAARPDLEVNELHGNVDTRLRKLAEGELDAIVLAVDGATVGVGMGQVNRVDAARLAVARAGEERVRDAVAASDAYFPFPDGLEVLALAGVRAVVQPGGSVRDPEVVAAAEAAGVSMYFTGVRHFYH